MKLVFKKKQDITTAICCGIDDKSYSGKVIIPPMYDGAIVDSIAPSAFLNHAYHRFIFPAQ